MSLFSVTHRPPTGADENKQKKTQALTFDIEIVFFVPSTVEYKISYDLRSIRVDNKGWGRNIINTLTNRIHYMAREG